MASAPRIRDVARRAGVSTATVSMVLNGVSGSRVATATRDRIQEAAAELGYRPNGLARSLRLQSSATIGFVSDEIATTPFAGQTILGAQECAAAHHKLLMLVNTGRDPELEELEILALLDRQVDGVVYASMYTREVTLPDVLKGRPVVLLNCFADGSTAPAVIPDEINAGRTAAQVLIEAGHRNDIYVIGGLGQSDEQPAGIFAGRERMNGIEDVMGQVGIRLAGIVNCERWEPESGYAAVAGILKDGHRPKALICCNDRLAMGAYEALAEAGLGIPDDVSVIAFDDQDLASWLRPKLTTVALPHYEIGRLAVELLLAEQMDSDVHRVAMPLRRRESVGPVRTQPGGAGPAVRKSDRRPKGGSA
jgi:LacI family transcriptional regulator